MTALRAVLAAASAGGSASLFAPFQTIALEDLAARTGLGAARDSLKGASILLRTRSQIAAAQAMVELDGLARRMVLCPPDMEQEHLAGVLADAGIDAIVTDLEDDRLEALGPPVHHLALPTEPVSQTEPPHLPTEWLMFTSGTTGAPKMVIHSLAGLTGAIKPRAANGPPVVWSTFYDIRRYGGLQILLRALMGGSSMILSDPDEPTPAFLTRLGQTGVTHISGTPSHWRRALMTPELKRMAPGYVRLSGEIADQAVLDSLAATFPASAVGHAYASTEAGVGFEVNDGREGFPVDLIDREGAEVEMRVIEGALQIRSRRTASGYAGRDLTLVEADGFVDTGDLVERRGDRYYFCGRRNGVINIGGLKVHPEEVETVINRHPGVRLSRVRGRRSPITGALVAAEVVRSETGLADTETELKASILAACRQALPAFKTPASLKFVPHLAMTAGGKLDRQGA